MSEVQARPAPSRGRGSGRGGRGGYAARGGARSSNRPATNGDAAHETESALPSIEDQGDTGQLKKKYSSKVGAVKEMFPDWSEVDILYALHETNGDENVTVTRILEGMLRASPECDRFLAQLPALIVFWKEETISRTWQRSSCIPCAWA